MTPGILGIDPGLRGCGLALLELDGTIVPMESGHALASLQTEKLSTAMALRSQAEFARMTVELFAGLRRLQWCVLEDPYLPTDAKGFGAKAQQANAISVGVLGCAVSPYVESLQLVPVRTWKKHWGLNPSKAKPRSVTQALARELCRSEWPGVTFASQDERDAALLASVKAYQLREPGGGR